MIDNEKHTKTGEKSAKPDRTKYVLQLYITGASPNSIRAVNNITLICQEHLKENCSLEIVDVYQHRDVAAKEQLLALPLLIKRHPLPERKLIGDLSDTQKVLNALGLSS